MILDDGCVVVSRKTNVSPAGNLPSYSKETVYVSSYGNKTVGISRFYSALANNRQADLLIEINRCGAVRANDVCALESFKDDGLTGDYEVIQVQHLKDEDGIDVTDLTLERKG